MNFNLLSAAIFAAAVSFASPAIAQGRQNFTLINDTGYTISEVYVSRTATNDWEEDVLGEDTLEDETSTEIAFSRANKSCMWDLKVVYDDDTSAVWKNFNLCTISEIAISYNAETGKTWANWE